MTYNLPRGKYHKGYWILPDKDRTKKFAIVDNGKIVSKHINFYLAQTGSERLLRKGKLTNNYKIVSLDET